jgi:hypothetical protein
VGLGLGAAKCTAGGEEEEKEVGASKLGGPGLVLSIAQHDTLCFEGLDAQVCTERGMPANSTTQDTSAGGFGG